MNDLKYLNRNNTEFKNKIFINLYLYRVLTQKNRCKGNSDNSNIYVNTKMKDIPIELTVSVITDNRKKSNGSKQSA